MKNYATTQTKLQRCVSGAPSSSSSLHLSTERIQYGIGRGSMEFGRGKVMDKKGFIKNRTLVRFMSRQAGRKVIL